MPGALSAGTVSLGVKPDSNGFGKKLADGILGESGMLNGVGKHLGGTILAGLGTVGIAVGVGEFVKKGVEEYSTADALNAQFAAGIKSTNNAAGLTVKGMDDLAKSVAGYSGQAFASIGKTEQILQTFTNIKNVGPHKIFDDTTTAAANMAAKLGGDASQSAMQLGIALNDPIKGVARLHRVGVAFTQAQMDQIKAMEKSGNMMGAQSVILKELNTEFGGAAKAAGETLPGEIARSKVAFGELAKAVMSGVMPFVVPVITAIADGMNRLTPHIEHAADLFKEKLSPAVHVAGDAFKLVVGTFTGMGADVDLGKWTNPVIALGAALRTVVDAGKLVVGTFTGKGADVDLGKWTNPVINLGATLRRVFDGIKSAVGPVLHTLMDAFKQLWPAIQPLIPQVLALFAAFSPIQIAFKALAPMLPTIVGLLRTLGTTLAGALISALRIVLPVLTKLAGIMSIELMKVVQMLIPVVVRLIGVIGPALGTVLAAVMPIVGLLAQFLGELLQAVLPLINPVLALVMAFVPLLNPLIKLTTSILMPLVKMLMAVLPPVMAIAIALVSVLVPAVVVVGDILAKVFGGIGKIIIGAFQGVVDFVKGVLNTIGGLINGIIDGVNGFTGLGAAIGVNIGKIPHLPKLADGGDIVQPGSVIVGERGPEVLNLPRGASVVPLNAASKSAPSIVNNIYEAVSARATALQVSRLQAARSV